MDEDHVVEVSKQIDLNQEIIEQQNKVISDGSADVPEAKVADAVMEDVTDFHRISCDSVESHEIGIESHDISMESYVILVESHEIYIESQKSHVIFVESHVLRIIEDGSVVCSCRNFLGYGFLSIHFEALDNGHNTPRPEKTKKQIWGKKLTIERLTNEAKFLVDDSLFLLSKDEGKMGAYVEKLKILLDEVKADMPNPPSRNTGDVIGGIFSITKPNQIAVQNPTKAVNKGEHLKKGERLKSEREKALKVGKKKLRASDALKNKATDVKKKSVGKGNKSTVDKPKVNAPNPKDNKSKAHSDVVPVAEKSKPNPKQKEKSTVQELSEVPVLRSSNQKVNPDVMSKVVVLVSRSKETHVKRKMIVSNEDDRKKKLKGKSKKEDSDSELETDVGDSSDDEVDQKRKKLKIKAGLKRKTSGSDSSSIDTTKVKRLVSKLEKKVKKQESDEESVPKKGKKKEKQLTPEQAAHEEYLSTFPSLRVRTTRSFLFSAIKNSRVNILRFLTDIGFSSLHNVSIDQLPSKLGWFVVSKFESYMLSLDTGDKIEVTRQKIHDMFGVPVGGYSLFDFDEREADHEFVKLWVGQFNRVELRDLRVNDIARKLVAAKEIDFLFKVNHLTLFTNTMGKADRLNGQICLDVARRLREDSVISDIDWCGYIYDCLRDSKLPPGTNHYIGPLTFLILLYLDSTKFDRFPVVRTRPAIRNWSTYLMKQRQESELKNHVLRLLDLHVEWTEAEVQDAKGFIGSLEISEKEVCGYTAFKHESHHVQSESHEILSNLM
ncbi:hypothetical protein Tco_1289809 [Tanacetum coccineum]